MAVTKARVDVVADLSRLGNGRLATVRPVSCPVDPMRRFLGPTQAPPPGADEAGLCRLLEWAYGHRRALVEGQRQTRRAPSAGALYPVEVLVVSRGRPFYYDFVGHRLHALHQVDGDRLAENLDLATDEIGVVLVGILWRTVQRYGTRGYRYCQLDAAHVTANLAAAADASGMCLEPVVGRPMPAVDRIVGLRRGEHALMAFRVPRGPRAAAIPDPLRTAPARPGPVHLRVSPEQPPYLSPMLERVVQLHQKVHREQGGGSGTEPLLRLSPPLPGPVFDVLDQRHSARDFTGEALTSAQLGELCAAIEATAGMGYAERVAPVRVHLLDRATTPALQAACQGQGLVGRAGLAMVVSAETAGIRAHGHGGYTRAVFNAGLVTAALYRAAVRCGADTTTIGGFADHEVARLTGDWDGHPVVIQVFGHGRQTGPKFDAQSLPSGNEENPNV